MAVTMAAAATDRGVERSTLLAQLIGVAAAAYVPDVGRRAAGRARFDYLACRNAGERHAPASLGPAGVAALGDLDDLHWPSLTHLGAIVWAAIDECGGDEERIWRAAHMGYEVGGRLGLALGAEHRRYWHVSCTAGTVAAAIAAATALGTDPISAAGHALSVAGGSILCILEYTDTRVLHRDHAMATGVRCARGAELSAVEDSLEHPRGFLAAMGGSPAGLVEPRPRTVLEELSFRRYATSGFNQAAVEVAQEFGPIDGGCELAEIELAVPDATAAIAGIADPGTREQAWWSCQHAVAATLLGRDLATVSVDDPEVARLRGRITLVAGSPVTRLVVGDRAVERDRAEELTDDDLIAKWRRLNPDTEPPLELLA